MNKYVSQVEGFRDIIIYGEGKIGKQTFQILKELGLEHKVRYFAKSEKIFESYLIQGIQVKSIYDLKEYYTSAIFLLAVGDKYISELKKIAKDLKIKHKMDARKVYAESYQKSDLWLMARKRRIAYYKWKECQNHNQDSINICASHITYCFVSNAGDTVLSQCVRRFLGFRKWNIMDVSQKVDQNLIEEINKSDILLIGGGGLFLPDTNENSISGWQWAISKEQIDQIKVPIVIFSVGYNYFRGQTNSELFTSSLNHIVRKAAFVGLRNKGSVEVIKELVDDSLKDKILYQPCTTTLISKIYGVYSKRNTKVVAFNIAFDREERRYGDNKEVILSQVAMAARLIEEKGYEIVYVAHSDGDLRFLPYLNKAGVNYKVKNLTQSFPGEVIRFYKHIEIVIGMRGHAQMIPFGVGVKIISLGTHDKMRWFLQDISMEECYINLNEECDKISNRIMKIFSDIVIKYAEEMDMKLRNEQERLWEISCENKKEILHLLDEYKNIETKRDN